MAVFTAFWYVCSMLLYYVGATVGYRPALNCRVS